MHIPVLLEPVVTLWASLDKNRTVKEGIYVDATFGKGGHSQRLLNLSEKAKGVILVGLDWDSAQIEDSKINFQKRIEEKRLFLFQDNFKNIEKVVSSFQKKQKKNIPVRGVLLDLGLCTDHLKSGRGFSFQAENDPLDMRFDTKEDSLTAVEILNSWPKNKLEEIFKEKGEERYWRKVAKSIILERRKGKYFKKVADLLEVLEKILKYPYRKQKIHYATRVFQALRMAVNEEEGNIRQGLEDSLRVLSKGGRIVAISFHSGEDRIVKNFFRQESKDCLCQPNLPECICNHQKSLQIITRKPVAPSPNEITLNPNARSAKLRAAEKISL